MKILQVCSATSFGGGERHVTDLARGLFERGHDVHLAVRPRSPLRDVLADVPIAWHELPLRNSLDPPSILGLAQLIRRESVEVLHAHVGRDYIPAGLAARLVQRTRPVRLFLTRHHFLPIKGGRPYAWAIGLLRRFFAVSGSVEQTLRTAFPGLADRIEVVPNWIDVRRAGRIPRDEARQSLGIQRSLAIGLVGQITPIKRQETLIRSAARLIASGACSDTEFVIVGAPGSNPDDAAYATRLRQLARELGVADALRFVGFVPDISERMRAFDLVVVPSEAEAFSLVLLEAMSSGCAAIASRTGGMSEIVRHERTGWLVEPHDDNGWDAAIRRLLHDEQLRRDLTTAARADVQQRFDREAVISRIESLYRA